MFFINWIWNAITGVAERWWRAVHEPLEVHRMIEAAVLSLKSAETMPVVGEDDEAQVASEVLATEETEPEERTDEVVLGEYVTYGEVKGLFSALVLVQILASDTGESNLSLELYIWSAGALIASHTLAQMSGPPSMLKPLEVFIADGKVSCSFSEIHGREMVRDGKRTMSFPLPKPQ